MSAIVSVPRSLLANWTFARAMAARDLKGLNKGAVLGLAWIVIRPLIQVAAYVVIVTYVFGARLGPDAGPLDYALYVLPGLIAWQAMQRTLEEAPSLIRDRMEVLKQVVYPVETLPLTAMFSSLLGPAVALALYLMLALAQQQLPWSALLLPLPLALLVVMMLGASYLFMVAGVLLKDLREIVGVLLGLMIYFSPVLLSPEMVGERIWSLIMLNPLAHVVICFRDVLRGGFHPESWLVFAAGAAIVFALGSLVIHRAKLTINEYL
jgi:lipopolysaccharide transport system permease protein